MSELRDTPSMAVKSATPTRYSSVAIFLHWLMSIAVIGMLGVGLWMHELKNSPFKIEIYTWHKWVGLTILMLAVVRLLWRVHRPPPPMPPMPRWQELAADGSHYLLYGLLFAMPTSGWLMNSAAGFPLTWFGLFKVPALLTRNKDAFEFWQETHELLAFALIALICVHIAAAIKHHFIDRDNVLARMLPLVKPRKPAPAKVGAEP